MSSDLIARRKQLAAAKELHFDQQKEIAAKHTKQLQVKPREGGDFGLFISLVPKV